MSYTHRPVEENDLAAICSWPQNAEELFYLFPKATYPLTINQLQEAIASRSHSTVVESEGKPIGFANFYCWQIGGNCSIGNVIVAPNARGKGAAQYLIQNMIDIARQANPTGRLTISCFNHNTAALLLYPTLGFQPYAIEQRLDLAGQRIALIHMHLSLDNPYLP